MDSAQDLLLVRFGEIKATVSRETIALGLEYLGTAFHGFQSQRGPTTVQDVLEKALARVAGEAIRVTAAGRTDAGVHATHQVVSFTGPSRPLSAWVNARRSAARRRYMYVFGEADPRPAIGNDLAHWQTKVLDVERMEAAAQILIGEHDFSSFRAAQCQAPTPNRRIEKLSVSRNGRMVVIDTIANAFLMHMVRNIAGTLEQVGLNEHYRCPSTTNR